MNKEAIAAKSLLKALAGGATVAGLAGGAGYLGHEKGYKSGANRATEEMASAFSAANQRENSQIADSFKLFNKKENAMIANSFMRRGMALGAELHARGKIRTPSEMTSMTKKSALEDIYNESFNDELEKYASYVGSFRRLGRGIKMIGARLGKMKGETASGKAHNWKRIRETAMRTLGGSKAALGTIGGTGALGAYALS